MLIFSSSFRIDNTDHIIDVNQGRGRHLYDYDQINIVCPFYASEVENPERFVVYSVDKEEYDTCRITKQHPRVIAQCDQPTRSQLFFTITFR